MLQPIEGQYQTWNVALHKMACGKIMCWGESSFYKMEDSDVFYLDGNEWKIITEWEHLRENSLWRDVE